MRTAWPLAYRAHLAPGVPGLTVISPQEPGQQVGVEMIRVRELGALLAQGAAADRAIRRLLENRPVQQPRGSLRLAQGRRDEAAVVERLDIPVKREPPVRRW